MDGWMDVKLGREVFEGVSMWFVKEVERLKLSLELLFQGIRFICSFNFVWIWIFYRIDTFWSLRGQNQFSVR